MPTDKQQTSELDDGTRDELLMLYETSVQDLAFFKQQQWNVTNYVLVLDAALVGARQLVGGTVGIWIVSIAALVLCFVGVLQLNSLQESMEASRARLRRIRERLSREFLDAWDTKAKRDYEPVVFLRLAMVAGVIAVGLLAMLGSGGKG
jgi:hypothetical protein